MAPLEVAEKALKTALAGLARSCAKDGAISSELWEQINSSCK